MPYPSRIDYDTLIATAVELVERDGADALSLGKLAGELGVRAPSLYRYIANKAALLEAVNLHTLQALFAAFEAALAAAPDDPTAQLEAVADVLRDFAHAHPHTYVMAMTAAPSAGRPDEDLLVSMILPIQTRVAALVGVEASLSALRGLLALIHGFIMLELNEQLQRGGDLDDAFHRSVAAYLAGWRALIDRGSSGLD